jgi:hypothetical protein
MGVMMPIGGRGQMIYIPDGNDGPTGPWTMQETKVTIAICIVLFIISLFSILIEWQVAKKRISLKEYLYQALTCGMSITFFPKYEVSIFTGLTTLCFYIVFVCTAIGLGVYGLMQIL